MKNLAPKITISSLRLTHAIQWLASHSDTKIIVALIPTVSVGIRENGYAKSLAKTADTITGLFSASQVPDDERFVNLSEVEQARPQHHGSPEGKRRGKRKRSPFHSQRP